MKKALFLLTVLLALSDTSAAVAGDPGAEGNLGIEVPPGFSVSLYADDDLAHDIYSMTVDSHGRVVVAGARYVKILHDDDNDGRADRATLFSDQPASGAHGMVFDGNDLICTGDNSVMRLVDADGDSVADGEPQVWTNLRHPEHGANGLVQGPDGCFYLICGNDAGVSEKQITVDNSPVKHPRCGAVVRFSRDGKPLDVQAHGFRNCYDLDFNAHGHLFTVDSDGERDYHLPWYVPTRLFDVGQGMEHGWLLQGWTRSWNRPQSFFDNVERLVEIGRGSPTGLIVYRHRQFPARYQGAVFSACWTLGRVYCLPLEPSAGTYTSHCETFMQTTGDAGFAPCDLAVGPEGDLFVAIGGRRTRGGVFRLRYTGEAAAQATPSDPLQKVLSADQPLSSWSRAAWVPEARQLDAGAFTEAVCREDLSPAERIRAVEVLVDLFDGVLLPLAERAARQGDPEVKARIAWAFSRRPLERADQAFLARLTHDDDPRVARAAWESLSHGPLISGKLEPSPNWLGALNSPLRRVRAAAIRTARGAGRSSYEVHRKKHLAGSPSALDRLSDLRIRYLGENVRVDLLPPDYFETCLGCVSKTEPAVAIEAVRLLQIGLGDLRIQPGKLEVYSGYLGSQTDQIEQRLVRMISNRLSPEFPTTDAELNRELARLLGMVECGSPRVLEAIAGQWTEKSTPEDDIHYLIVLSLLPARRSPEVTQTTAYTLLSLHRKLEERGQFPSQNWPFRVGEMFKELCRRDRELETAIVARPEFDRPEYALFAAQLRRIEEKETAVRRLLNAAKGRGEPPTAELIELLPQLPAQADLDYLRELWEEVGLRDSIIRILARRPDEQDRSKFVEALSSAQPQIVELAAQSIKHLSPMHSPQEVTAVMQALKLACAEREQAMLRGQLVDLLSNWSAKSFEIRETPDVDLYQTYGPWFAWFESAYPTEAAALRGLGGEDAEAWMQRFAAVDWKSGDETRGRAVFERKACHRCHQASGQLGPELTGAVRRMSRDDLFAAIIDPNKEVSPTFQTTLIATKSGQQYHGILVYESPEGTLLQTGPDTTVRITADEREVMRRGRQSLMPTGLLNGVTDQELADLYAYLKTLGSK